ncbi:hypothetical protein ABZ907_47300, partial [Nonomuraea wenchangensis]
AVPTQRSLSHLDPSTHRDSIATIGQQIQETALSCWAAAAQVVGWPISRQPDGLVGDQVA